MIQVGTKLNVIDNSGAKRVRCIKVSKGYKKRYSSFGDVVLVSIYSVRKIKSKAQISRVKRGEIYRALVVRTKLKTDQFAYKVNFTDNAVILLNKQNRLLGSRVFGVLPRKLRETPFLRLLSVSAGIA